MIKLSAQEKLELKAAKSNWRRRMANVYPGFEKRKWANTAYRINHPQPM